jgi:hypothetical protein
MQKCRGSPKVVSNSTASRCWSEDNPLPVIRCKIINMTNWRLQARPIQNKMQSSLFYFVKDFTQRMVEQNIKLTCKGKNIKQTAC